jgi:hypothetical protein
MNKLKLILVVFVISLSAFAQNVLKIESDPNFRKLYHALSTDKVSPEMYGMSTQYRMDLSLADMVDQVELLPNGSQLTKSLNGDLINFVAWFKDLKSQAKNNEELKSKLDRRLHLQLYALNGMALLPHYKIIDFKKVKELGLLRRVKRYNDLISAPDAQHLISLFELEKKHRFTTAPLTVAKLKYYQDRPFKRLKKAFYKKYASLIPNTKSVRGGGLKTTEKGKFAKYFNFIFQKQDKNELLSYLEVKTRRRLPMKNGLYTITPSFLKKNWSRLKAHIQSYTLESMISKDDAEYLYLVRKWHKKNKGQKISRLEAIEKLDALLKEYPDQPWLGEYGADLVTKNGARKYFDKSFGEKSGLRLKRIWNEVKKPEFLISTAVGAGVIALTAGNVSAGLSVRALLKKAIEPLRLDTDWNDFIREAPMEVIVGLIGGAGFTGGRFYKIIALGGAQGGLQSLITGQDVKTGVVVGAGMHLLTFYVLPQKIARPMKDGFSKADLRANIWLEVTERTVKGTAHGVVVAALTGDSIGKGAWRGALYGTVSSFLKIWILGTRYNPYKDYSDEDIDDMIAHENEFQNNVGRGGVYEIDRQLIDDANWRVNGLWPALAKASITLPGNIIMSDSGFERLTTMTHEAHHLMQQHQSGVFGFYLLRYFPTFLKTGYNGHPDENFLRNFLYEYHNHSPVKEEKEETKERT